MAAGGARSCVVANASLEEDDDLPNGRLEFVNHTLKFEEVEAVRLDGFGPQNRLDDLIVEEVRLAAGRQPGFDRLSYAQI